MKKTKLGKVSITDRVNITWVSSRSGLGAQNNTIMLISRQKGSLVHWACAICVNLTVSSNKKIKVHNVVKGIWLRAPLRIEVRSLFKQAKQKKKKGGKSGDIRELAVWGISF